METPLAAAAGEDKILESPVQDQAICLNSSTQKVGHTFSRMKARKTKFLLRGSGGEYPYFQRISDGLRTASAKVSAPLDRARSKVQLLRNCKRCLRYSARKQQDHK